MGNPPWMKMYLLLKMVVFQPAMLVYQRVAVFLLNPLVELPWNWGKVVSWPLMRFDAAWKPDEKLLVFSWIFKKQFFDPPVFLIEKSQTPKVAMVRSPHHIHWVKPVTHGADQVTYNFAMYGILLNKRQDDELARQAWRKRDFRGYWSNSQIMRLCQRNGKNNWDASLRSGL